jgi:hypothetical protein
MNTPFQKTTRHNIQELFKEIQAIKLTLEEHTIWTDIAKHDRAKRKIMDREKTVLKAMVGLRQTTDIIELKNMIEQLTLRIVALEEKLEDSHLADHVLLHRTDTVVIDESDSEEECVHQQQVVPDSRAIEKMNMLALKKTAAARYKEIVLEDDTDMDLSGTKNEFISISSAK